MGTNNFAKEILKTLLTMPEVNLTGVICQPDRKLGRKQTVVFSPVKELTLAKILPLNIHASLLPKLRGGAPIQWAIINNFSETGITLMKMVQKMDAGAIFSQSKVKITNNETYHSLQLKLIALAQTMIKNDLLAIANGKIKTQIQDESAVTFGFNITRKDELINWNQRAQLVSCQVRGLYDQPIAYSTIAGFIYKIHQVTISKQVSKKPPGMITLINKLGIFVATTDFDIIITKIQPAGKTVINANNYFGSKSNPIKVALIFK